MNDFLAQFTPYIFERLGYIKIPTLSVSEEERAKLKLRPDATNDDYLARLVKNGFKTKTDSGAIPKDKVQIYWKRAELELAEIQRLLFTDYILLVFMVIQFCRQKGILNSPSRGSCGGSLILFLLGVTQIDPVKFDLLFERFISATRAEVKDFGGIKLVSSASLPDVDIDSDAMFKGEINKFIEEKFPGQSAAILNLSTFQGKAVIKECLKCVEGASEEEAQVGSDLIRSQFGKVDTIEESLRTKAKDATEKFEPNVAFQKWAASHPRAIAVARKLNGLIKNKSVHASGIIICDQPVLEVMPLEVAADKRIVTAYDMEYAQCYGVKLDNLGLKNLSIVKQCLAMIGKKMSDIDVNDKSIYAFLNGHDEYYGVFQAEEGLGKQVMKSIGCQNINDISASIAIGRPGAMRFADDYAAFKRTGEANWSDERVKDILEPTGGIIIYQEQIMQLCGRMANFTPAETNQVRKGVGKKDSELLAKYKTPFIENSIKNGFDPNYVEDIWQTFEDSGNYLFNKCLSPDSVVETKIGPKTLADIETGEEIQAFDTKSGRIHYVKVTGKIPGYAELSRVEFEDGTEIQPSAEHKFLCEDLKMRSIGQILGGDFSIIAAKTKASLDPRTEPVLL